jgi:serine/threonine-protein kinase RsbT
VVIEVVDQGHGIGDVGAAITDGWSEGGRLTPERVAAARGLGVGLGSVHRMMDQVEIETDPGRGTRIVARKFAR